MANDLTKEIDYIFVRGVIGQSIFPVICLGYEKCTANKKPANFISRATDALHFVISGSGYVVKNGISTKVSAGHLFYIASGSNIIYYPNKKNPWTYIWMDVQNKDAFPLYLANMGIHNTGDVISIQNYPFVKEKLINIFESTRGLNSHYYQAESLAIISLLFERKEHQSKKISEILEYINENYKLSSLTVNNIADHFAISAEHLSRLFKNECKQNLNAFINQLRFEEAINLLNRNISTKKIASMVGFESDSYFCKAFKKRYGVSPKQYIKK